VRKREFNGKRKETPESLKIVWGYDVRWCVPTVAVNEEKHFYLRHARVI
jgi:hypothetical protein